MLRVFYPALLRPDDAAGMLVEEEESLRRLAWRSGFYLLIAAGVPLLTLAMLIVIHAAMDRGWLALLTLAGLLGLAFATWARQAIEADVAAVIAAGRPLESLRSESRIGGTR